jgi:RecJ-like exonuclease
MIKVHILDRCEFCDGEAYILDCQDVDSCGEPYDRYRPCEVCHASGNQAKWVDLREFADLLERAAAGMICLKIL